VFEESGDRYPFEFADRYQLPRKRDRVTPHMLHEYLAHFGIVLLSDDFVHLDCTTPPVRQRQIRKVWHSPEFAPTRLLQVNRGSADDSCFNRRAANPLGDFHALPVPNSAFDLRLIADMSQNLIQCRVAPESIKRI
jgi:hypothetical protein